MEGIQYYGAFHGAEVPFVFGDQFELSSDGERAVKQSHGLLLDKFRRDGQSNKGPGDCAGHLSLPHWPHIQRERDSR